MYAYYKEYASKFSPDIILFFIGNADFYENYAEWVTLDSVDNLPDVEIEQQNLKAKSWANNLFKGRFVLPPLIFKCGILMKADQTGEILFGKYYSAINKKEIKESLPNDSLQIDMRLLDGILDDLSFKNEYASKPLAFFVLLNEIPEVVNEKFSVLTPFVLDLKSILKNYKQAGHKLYYWKATTKTGHWNHEGHHIIADFITTKLMEQYLKNSKKF
jgi:hypothetical protein